jgi:intracellular multiplication protein IcmX
MKKISQWICGLGCIVSSSVWADLPILSPGQQNMSQMQSNTSNIAQYLLNLGQYLGYDLTKQASITSNQNNNQPLLAYNTVAYLTQNAYQTMLGAMTVNTIGVDMSNFVPSSNSNNKINLFSNYVFGPQLSNQAPFSSSTGSTSGVVSVIQNVDQPTYQSDPVSQALLDMMSTPDQSFCDDKAFVKPPQVCQQEVLNTVQGAVPSTGEFFTYAYNQQIVPQLNSNALIGPLMYDTTVTNAPNAGATGLIGGLAAGHPQNTGLPAFSQAQLAANFVRYATGIAAPFSMPTKKTYDYVYGSNPNALQQYFSSMRGYVAQSSVPVSNLYYMLSKRMPQTVKDSKKQNKQTSEALSEYRMASWRITPGAFSDTGENWLDQINQASTATTQKEIAVLLAEINYQLYLSRQLEERILLTNTMLLVQSNKFAQPNASLQESSGGEGTSGGQGSSQGGL